MNLIILVFPSSALSSLNMSNEQIPQQVTFLICIQEKIGSNLGQETDISD